MATPYNLSRTLLPRTTLLTVLLLIVLPLMAEPVVTFGGDATVQAVLSTPVNDYWSTYPRYATDIAPFFAARFGIEDRYWKVESEFDFFQQYTSWRTNNLPLPDSASRRAFPVEYHGLRKGDFSYNFNPLTIAFGRNKVHWGPTRDSLIIDDQIPFLDRFEMRLPMGDWAFDYLVASPETRGVKSMKYPKAIFLLAHRLSWRAGGWEIGFTEQAVLDRNRYDSETGKITRDGTYLMTDFLPFFSVHQGDQKPFNSMMVLDVSWTLGDWRLALESGLDDVNAANFGIADDPVPTISANLFEIRWSGAPWDWSLSVGNTSYLWGNYETRLGKSVYRILLDNGVQEQPLTSPYGPGATWGSLTLAYQMDDVSFDARADVWSVLRGVSLDIPYDSPTPRDGYDVFARGHLFASTHFAGFRFKTGPQLLVASGALSEQWYFELSTTFGSPASSYR